MVHPAIVCFFLIIAVDALSLWGSAFAPQRLGEFACSILPFAKLTAIFLSSALSSYATTQCSQIPQEPAISIIFFMTKLLITCVAAVAVWLGIFILPGGFRRAEDEFNEKIEREGGLWKGVRDSGAVMIGLTAFSLYWLLTIEKSVAHFGTNVFNKLVEDFACLVMLLTLFALSWHPFFLVVRLLKKGRFK